MSLNRRSIAFAVLAVGWLGVADPLPARALTLEEALALTYDTNPTLLAARAQLRAQNENVSQARSGWRPSVNSNLSVGMTKVDAESRGVQTDGSSVPKTAGISVNQPIYTGGRIGASIDGAEADVQAGRAQLFNAEQTVLLQGVVAYVNLLREEATLELRVNNLQRLNKQLEATRDRFRVGEVTRTDVSQAEARVSRARADRTQAEGDLVTSRVAFERVVGRLPDTLLTPATPAGMPVSRDEAVDIALRGNYTLIQAKFTELAAQHRVDESASALLPSVNLVARADQAYDTGGLDNESRSLAAEVQVSIPIYQRGTTYSLVRQAKENANRSRLLVDSARREVVDSAARSFETYQTTLARIESLKAEVGASEVALDGVQQEATVGARTVLDVLDAEQELLNGQVSLVQAERDAIVAGYQVLQALGRLTAQDLGLPVEIYDYDRHYVDVSGKLWGTEPAGRMPGN